MGGKGGRREDLTELGARGGGVEERAFGAPVAARAAPQTRFQRASSRPRPLRAGAQLSSGSRAAPRLGPGEKKQPAKPDCPDGGSGKAAEGTAGRGAAPARKPTAKGAPRAGVLMCGWCVWQGCCEGVEGV